MIGEEPLVQCCLPLDTDAFFKLGTGEVEEKAAVRDAERMGVNVLANQNNI